ncbi:MBOAT, membrane-bound O-acyltransferase family-domain-containing protein, partial [Blyttiomyces helicus]
RKTSFRPRPSPLDWETLERDRNPMRGFFTLFWMAMAAYMAGAFWNNYRVSGIPVSLSLFNLFSKDSSGLALADLTLVASTFVVVGIQKCLIWGIVPRSAALIVQHTWQSLWFATCISWVFYKDWPWVQSGFFVLHSMSMLMKQHSYLSYNRSMCHKDAKLRALQRQMDDIAGRMKQLDDDDSALPDLEQEWNVLRTNAEDLQVELCKGKTRYPANVTVANFTDYLLVPTLVYELEYPRTNRVRPIYIVEKGVATLGTFMILYVTVEHYINPVLYTMNSISFVDALARLLLPFMVCYLLVFYIIFECILNGFAEITRFADREFYEDWWNSVTFDEYARKWNKPVHEFLLRHVYNEGLTTYKLSKTNATFLTFFLSSCLHELVMFCI